jgi:Ser/Thr protein kinase RdoA (MazF antagonist)
MEMAQPALATCFARALDDIATSAQGRIEAAPVASHGALRTDQFMIERDRLVLIDLDSFCWANPARDIANFLAYLRWKSMRQPQHAAFIARGANAFLAGYANARAMPEEEWLARYQAVALLKIAGRRFRNLTIQEWPLAVRLLDVALALFNSDSQVPAYCI